MSKGERESKEVEEMEKKMKIQVRKTRCGEEKKKVNCVLISEGEGENKEVKEMEV